MKDQFPGYYAPDGEAFERLWAEGRVALDANVLLDAFRYSESTSEELLTTLEQLGDRVWMPYQAALEYHASLPDVLTDQAKSYDKATRDVDALLEQLTSDRRHPFVSDELMQQISAVMATLKTSLSESRSAAAALLTDNPLKDRIAGILSGKVGPRFSASDLSEIYKEGHKRYAARTPPGYKDKDKEPETHRFGDLVIWREILRLAANDNCPVIFVTADTKEDWFLSAMGMTIGPRPELVQEFAELAPGPFHAYPTDRFLSLARDRLDAKVSEDSLTEIKEVSERSTWGHTSWVAALDRARDLATTSSDLSTAQALAREDLSIRSLLDHQRAVEDYRTAQRHVDDYLLLQRSVEDHLRGRKAAEDYIRSIALLGGGDELYLPHLAQSSTEATSGPSSEAAPSADPVDTRE